MFSLLPVKRFPLVIAGVVAGLLVLPEIARAQFGPSKVVTAKVVQQPMPLTMTLVGTVGPKTRSLVGTEVAGMVTEMPARQGNLVSKGDLLCKLNQDTFGADLESAQARLQILEERLLELRNGTRKEDLTRLKANLEAATARAERWSFELDRIRRLTGAEFANQREYQDALSEHSTAIGEQLAAQAEYDKAVAGPRAEVLAQATHEVAQQQAQVKRIELDFEKASIRAPFGGFVVKRHAEVGNWLQVGGAVVELADASSVLVEVNAPESAVPFATIGAPVTVQIDALKKRYEGKIRHVIPQADPAARTFPIQIEVANPDFKLKAGMFARATIPAGGEKMSTVVHKDALIESGGTIFVAMIIDGAQGKMAMPVPVTLGADQDEFIAITSNNLPPNATIAVYGNERLTYPQPVMPVASKEEIALERAGHSAANPAETKETTGS